jgi:hypothetical protein
LCVLELQSRTSAASRLRNTLVAAKSIAYFDSGSGTYLSTTLFPKLGVAHIGEELRLVLACFGKVAALFLELVEQPCILNRHRRLGGEGPEQVDRVCWKLSRRLAADTKVASRRSATCVKVASRSGNLSDDS